MCEIDTSARQKNCRSEVNNLISVWNVTSHADETEIMGGDCSVSNTAAYDCRMLFFIWRNSDTFDDDETKKGLVIVRLAMRSGGTIVGLFKLHQQEAQRVTTWSRARQH